MPPCETGHSCPAVVDTDVMLVDTIKARAAPARPVPAPCTAACACSPGMADNQIHNQFPPARLHIYVPIVQARSIERGCFMGSWLPEEVPKAALRFCMGDRGVYSVTTTHFRDVNGAAG